MATTTAPPQGPDTTAAAPPAAKIRKVRGPWFAAAGIIMAIAIGGALYLYGQTATRTQYLGIVDDMARGELIERDNLGLVGLQADADLNFVLPGEADMVVGQRLVADLEGGTVLTHDLVSSGETVPEGKALVGLNLQAGEYPTANIGVGDYLAVVAVPNRRGDGLEAYELARAEVYSRTLLSDANMRLFLTVAVDEDRANYVSALHAAGSVYIVQTDTLEPGPTDLAGLPLDQLPFDSTGDGLDDRTGDPMPEPPPAEELLDGVDGRGDEDEG